MPSLIETADIRSVADTPGSIALLSMDCPDLLIKGTLEGCSVKLVQSDLLLASAFRGSNMADTEVICEIPVIDNTIDIHPLVEEHFLNSSAGNEEDDIDCENIYILTETDENMMWPPPGEENFPEEVNLLEVEIIATPGGQEVTLTDLSQSNVIPDVDLSSGSPSSSIEYHSDYGSESGTDHTSEMDLSKNGSHDYPRSSFTELQRPLDFNRGHAHHHPQTGALDLRAGNMIGTSSLNGISGSLKNASSQNLNGVNKSPFMHYSGGFAEDLSKNRSVVEGLLDLSTSGTAFQMPRIKLQPGLGIDPTISYKPEVDCNHNEAVKVENLEIPMETYTPQSDAVVTIPKVCQGEGLSNDMTYMSSEYDSSSTEPAVQVEEVEHCNSSQIPLTVTSPDDDDNDSGTESVDSKSSEKSLDKSHKKRPGRKKGQVSKVYHLWEFIRDVLADPRYCPTVIKWENQDEGIFRVVQSEIAAAMWGNKKNNRTKMTYEKMSRSIRYSRKEGYFADIPRDKGYPKKLCFKFGHKAHGWNSKIKK